MFIGRTKELRELTNEITNKKSKTAILIYGKRRVGKSTLIKEAAKSFDGIVIDHLCIQSTFEGNLTMLYRSVSEGLSLPNIRFDSGIGFVCTGGFDFSDSHGFILVDGSKMFQGLEIR